MDAHVSSGSFVSEIGPDYTSKGGVRMYAPSEAICREIVWAAFARVNPVYSPRRNKDTAERWANACAHLIQWLIRLGNPPVDSKTWAARVILDLSSRGDGVIAAMEKIAATAILSRQRQVSDLEWTAWSTLFPRTADLARGCLHEDVTSEWTLMRRDLKCNDDYPWMVTIDGVDKGCCSAVDFEAAIWPYTSDQSDDHIHNWQTAEVWDTLTGERVYIAHRQD